MVILFPFIFHSFFTTLNLFINATLPASTFLTSFPRCSWQGHYHNGYGKVCGTEVTIVFTVDFNIIGGTKDDLLVLGEIKYEGEKSTYLLRSVVQKTDLHAHIASNDDTESQQRSLHQAELTEILGDVNKEMEGKSNIRASVFPPSTGFNYPWTSNRWTCEVKHTFEWTTLQKVPGEDCYKVIQVHRPPINTPGVSFCVLSSRGKKGHARHESRSRILAAATQRNLDIRFEGRRNNGIVVQSQEVDNNVKFGQIEASETQQNQGIYEEKVSPVLLQNFTIENEFFDSFLYNLRQSQSPIVKKQKVSNLRGSDGKFVDPWSLTEQKVSNLRGSDGKFVDPWSQVNLRGLKTFPDFGLNDRDVEEVFKIIFGRLGASSTTTT